ncbi:hypothetical protein NX722_06135 [Endozoicomonas gorgoniicola]|uniref:Uncharacterized protein n=1 Tax=Endozoicomonas gorgoniicola TaxID=1234144 RepID=A0ABT3MS70_9GAMM|nr:hypothetical protein [Endozoicomonas gorgoniicola]MCW7552232.1 hypothetical protein [Endozoicomonas gorgoniicola]
MNHPNKLLQIICLFLSLNVICARGQTEVKFTNNKDFLNHKLTINQNLIKKHWFLYYPPESSENREPVKDMQAAQINCIPSSKVTGHLRCSVIYYLQGRKEDQFAGKGYAYEVTTEINPGISSESEPFEKDLKAARVHSSKLTDPVLIRYKGYSFVIGRKPRTTDNGKLLFNGVGLSMKSDQESDELNGWTVLDDISFSKSDDIVPEVFWKIRGNHLVLGGRQWRQMTSTEASYEVSTATYMKKTNWVLQIESAISLYNEQKHNSHALSEFKASISEAFKDFEVSPITWQERSSFADSIMDSTNYVALQPDIIFYENTPDLTMVHLRTRIEFPDNSARKQAPAMFAERNGTAYSVILKCDTPRGRMTCKPLSVFDNPWTKNTLQTFNGNNKQLYFIGNIAPSRVFNPGDRSQLFLYKTDLYKNFTANEFSSNIIHQRYTPALLEVPPAASQFDSDTTFPFFDPLTTNDPEQKCALFVTTVRTSTHSTIAILCLDKDGL